VTRALALLLALAAPALAQSADDRADELLGRARGFARQGLLSQVDEVLADFPAGADTERQGHAELLRGNVAYERGRFEEAAARYRHAESLLQQPGSAHVEWAAQTLAAAHDNLGMATTALDRHRELDRFLIRMRAALLGTLAAGGVAVLVIARRVRAPLRG